LDDAFLDPHSTLASRYRCVPIRVVTASGCNCQCEYDDDATAVLRRIPLELDLQSRHRPAGSCRLAPSCHVRACAARGGGRRCMPNCMGFVPLPGSQPGPAQLNNFTARGCGTMSDPRLGGPAEPRRFATGLRIFFQGRVVKCGRPVG
jgi:hypothetical protein